MSRILRALELKPERSVMCFRTVPSEAEICVLGGGPSGAATAMRLSALGHDVCLIERKSFPRPHVGESLPPNILPMLEALGLRERIENAGFLRPRQAIVKWAADRPREKPFSGESGFQVDRGQFDAILLDAARQAGVRVLQPANCRGPRRSQQGGWIVPVEHGGSTFEINASFVVDASGKHAILGGRRIRLGAKTMAIYAYWRGVQTSGSETRVEAGRRQWYWGAPLPDGTFNATVFIDPTRHACGGGDLRASYEALLAESALLRSCLQGRMTGSVCACDATSYASEHFVGRDWIKVGEAAQCIDPISSQGVQIAVRGGLQAAVVVHTIRLKPGNTDDAIQFYRDRQNETAERNQRLSAQFYAEQAEFRSSPFWRNRAAVTSAEPTPSAPSLIPTPLSLDEPVQLSALAELVDTPVIEGDFVRRQLSLKHPYLPRTVGFLNGIPIAPLIRELEANPLASELVANWSNRYSEQVGRALLHWFWSNGIIDS